MSGELVPLHCSYLKHLCFHLSGRTSHLQPSILNLIRQFCTSYRARATGIMDSFAVYI
jgi:hypothetical protein